MQKELNCHLVFLLRHSKCAILFQSNLKVTVISQFSSFEVLPSLPLPFVFLVNELFSTLSLSLMSSVSRLACTVLTQNRRWNFIPVSKFQLSNSSCPSTGLLYTNQLPLNAALVTHLTLPFTHIPTPGISAYHGSPVSIHSTRKELWSPVISPSICLLAFSPVTLPLFFTVLIDWRLALWTFTGTGEYLLTFNLDLSIRCILYNITENAVSHSWHLPSFFFFFNHLLPYILLHFFTYKIRFPILFLPRCFQPSRFFSQSVPI